MLNRETRYWQQFMHILYTYHTNMGGLRRLHSHIRLQTHQNGLKRIYCPCWPLVLKNIHFLWKQKSLNQLYRILVRFLPASYSTNTPLILQSDSQMTAEKKACKIPHCVRLEIKLCPTLATRSCAQQHALLTTKLNMQRLQHSLPTL